MTFILRYPALMMIGALLGGLFNHVFFANTLLGVCMLILYLYSISLIISRRYAYSIPQASIIVLCALMMIGSLYYYAFPTVTMLGLYMIAIFPLAFCIKKEIHKENISIVYEKTDILIILLTIISFITLQKYHFTESVRSPWDIVPTAIILIPLFILLSLLTIRTLKKRITPLAIIAPLFLALGVASTVYTLGYGFDPFIHRATIAHIIEHGTITPKPFYYIGQYMFELIGIRIFGISLAWLNTWLVPILASLLLPYAFWHISKKTYHAIPFLFLIPLSPFIFTTPQSLSYLFFALTIGGVIWFLQEKKLHTLFFTCATAFATAFIHPLAGIPACLSIALAFFLTRSEMRYRILAWITGITILISLPLLFFLQSTKQGLLFTFHLPNFAYLIPDFTNHYAGWLDILYTYKHLFIILYIALFAFGIFSYARQKEYTLIAWSTIVSGSMIINYFFFLFFFDFTFLVSSERTNYAERLPYLALLAGLPLFIQGCRTCIEYIQKRPLMTPAFILFISLLGTGNIYTSYPRNDGETRSAGFNVSTLDYQTVRSIHDLYPMNDYVVLGNQSLSASALDTYGFSHYYKNDIFYYPIPTGGPLYQLFLEMAKHPSRKIAKKAHDLTGAKHIIFVSHDYWEQSEYARETAKQNADQWYAMDPKEHIMVFLYDL